MKYSMLDKWTYIPGGMVCFSGPKQISYKKAGEFLGKDVPMEDWGGGTGWAKKYFTHYKNIDAATHEAIDIKVDLANYTSSVDNILIRQVLCYNWKWKKIIENAKKSFKKKLCIIINHPLVVKTTIYGESPVVDTKGRSLKKNITPDIYFAKKDILSLFPPEEYRVKDEILETDTPFGQEWAVYVEKINS